MPFLLLGKRELDARMDACKGIFQPTAQRWAEETVRLAKGRVPVKSGTLRNSIRTRTATARSATVRASYKGRFVESGTKAHTIAAKKKHALKFEGAGGTIFARKAQRRAKRADPFLVPSAVEALQRVPLRDELYRAWNDAA